MALELYELIPKLEQLKRLCQEHGLTMDPECGHRMFYQGQVYYVLSARQNQLALIDELPAIPFDPQRIVYVDQWEQEPSCLFVPQLDDLLLMIRERTTLFPSMTPGVKVAREVWQVRHNNGVTVVAGSLLEGLIDLLLEILSQEG